MKALYLLNTECMKQGMYACTPPGLGRIAPQNLQMRIRVLLLVRHQAQMNHKRHLGGYRAPLLTTAFTHLPLVLFLGAIHAGYPSYPARNIGQKDTHRDEQQAGAQSIPLFYLHGCTPVCILCKQNGTPTLCVSE